MMIMIILIWSHLFSYDLIFIWSKRLIKIRQLESPAPSTDHQNVFTTRTAIATVGPLDVSPQSKLPSSDIGMCSKVLGGLFRVHWKRPLNIDHKGLGKTTGNVWWYARDPEAMSMKQQARGLQKFFSESANWVNCKTRSSTYSMRIPCGLASHDNPQVLDV